MTYSKIRGTGTHTAITVDVQHDLTAAIAMATTEEAGCQTAVFAPVSL